MTRQWAHQRPVYGEDSQPPQAVDVLGWTQHGAIVIATEPGSLPMNEPVFVRMGELLLRGYGVPTEAFEDGAEAALTAVRR
jgi:hypothetical protein